MNGFIDKVMCRDIEGTLEAVHAVRLESWLPAWTVPFLIIAVALLCAFQYGRMSGLSVWKRALLVVLRVAGYLCLLFIFARPTIHVEAEGFLPGPVPVVLDGSQSMSIPDVGGTPRHMAAERLARELISLGDEYPDLRLYPYWAGHDLQEWHPGKTVTPDDDTTSLARFLADGIRPHLGQYCPGFILLTDGAHNATEDPGAALQGFIANKTPVFTIGIGDTQAKDVGVAFIMAESVVFLNETARLYVNLNQRGYAGGQGQVEISLNDRVVATEVLHFDERTEWSLPIDYVPDATGEFQLVVRVSSLEDESTLENNTYSKTIRVIDEKVKVLLVFGTPTWEFRYLSGALERDARVTMRVVLESLDSRIMHRTRTETYLTRLPSAPEQLSEDFDLVVLSAINVLGLPKAFREALVGFVRDHAGGLVVLSDRAHVPYTMKDTCLEELLPVALADGAGPTYRDEWSGLDAQASVLTITEEGLANPLLAFSGSREENRAIWEKFPPVYRCYRGGRLKPAAVSLLMSAKNAFNQSTPAIVQHVYGKGTVLFMGFDSTWRWRREYGDRYYREFWGKVVQFLGLPHLLDEAAETSLFVSREHCHLGDRVTVTANLMNPDYSPHISQSVPLTMRQENADAELALIPIPDRQGMYRVHVWPEHEGEILFELPSRFYTKPAKLRVSQRRREFVDSGMNADLLSTIADATGGVFVSGSNIDVRSLLDQVMQRRPLVSRRLKQGLWDRWPVLALFLTLFCLEWLFRKLFYLD